MSTDQAQSGQFSLDELSAWVHACLGVSGIAWTLRGSKLCQVLGAETCACL